MLTPSPPRFLRMSHDPSHGRVDCISHSHPGRRWGFEMNVKGEKLARWEEGEKEWKGWMACEWSLGHPQLFWVTGMMEGELPAFGERVRIKRQFL